MHHLDAAFTNLRAFPEIGPIFHGCYRRLLVPRFPYGIFYIIEPDRIIIAGVLHLRQNPAAIRRHIEG